VEAGCYLGGCSGCSGGWLVVGAVGVGLGWWLTVPREVLVCDVLGKQTITTAGQACIGTLIALVGISTHNDW
jgi:hypothetical protein